MDLPSVTDRSLNKILNFCKNYSREYFNVECCILIGINEKSKYCAQVVANRSPQPMEFFIIDPLDYLNFELNHKVLFIFHSHPHTESSFSEIDKSNCEAICIPFLMYSVQDDKFSLYVPQTSEVDVNILNKAKGLI